MGIKPSHRLALAACVAVVSSHTAWAQEVVGVDLHGEMVPLPTGHASSPVTTLGAPLGVSGAWSVHALGEFANDPARVYDRIAPGAPPVSRPLVDGFAMAHLGGAYAPSRRLSVGGALPVYFTAANYTSEMPTVGDLYLRGSLGLVLPDRYDLTGWSVGLMPMITLPTGNGQRLVGNELSGGVSAVAGHRWGGVGLDAHAGVRARETVELVSQTIGGLQLPWGGSVGVRLVEPLWARIEVRGMADPGTTPRLDTAGLDIGGLGSTVEGMVSVSGRLGSAWAAGALGTGLTSGVGAARSRGFVGVGYAHLPVPERPSGVLPVLTLSVVDPSGAMVEGAVVRGGEGELGRTDATGRVALTWPWPSDLVVEAPGMLPVALSAPEEGTAERTIEPGWAPAVLDARVTDPEGEVLQATLTATPAGGGASVTGAPGELELTPGMWEVVVAAPGMAPQRRTVPVDADGRPPAAFEAVLSAPAGEEELVLAIVDGDNRPVPGARVLVDGLPVGTVAGGAMVALAGLDGDDVEIEVQHPAFTTVVVDGVPGTPRTVVLARVPGSVKVLAVGPDGKPVDDALVRFIGPSRLAPAALGPRGERVSVLGPGRWDVLVSSPTYGLQRRVIDIAEDQYQMVTVEVRLQRDEGGLATLRVQVVDGAAQPVDGVEVLLGDVPFGETSTGGVLEMQGLQAGARDLQVRAPLLRPVEPRPLDLVDGLVDEVVPVRWVEGATEIRVVGPGGPVDDALVRLLGPETVVLPLGSDGVERTVVPPGEWTVLASSPTLGLQQRSLVVEAGSDRLHRVEVVLRPPEGGLADLTLQVVDPDGAPVAGAWVALDDVPLGATGPGGDLTLEQLAVGDRDLRVGGDLFLDEVRPLQLMEGSQTVETELSWAPGVVRVSVVAEGEAVEDAVVRVLGPEAVVPAAVDAAGQRTVLLAPGAWQLLVSSPRFGIAEAPVVVPAGLTDRMDVQVVLTAPKVGASELALAVVDPDGAPVVGATISVRGEEVGRTGEGGVLIVPDLRAGKVPVTIRHPSHEVWEVKLDGAAGSTARTVELPWMLRPLTVVVRGTDGEALPGATVQLVGPADVEPRLADDNGQATFAVRPGSWQVIATSGALGPVRSEVEVGGSAEASLAVSLVESELEVTDSAIALRRQVLFGFDSVTLSEGAGPVLDQVASALLGGSVVRVEVQGHSDAVGDLAYNQALSSARARAVLAALVERGVPSEALVARGYGPQRPVGSNDTDAGRAANRRVQFEILERAGD